MILPFVREVFAELEHSSGFERVRRHLSLGAGRRRVSGLTATARALYIPLMARAANRPVIVVVADNKAAEALEPMLRAGCELTGAIDPLRVVRLPAHDVLPFENLSPHPDVQEQRASALWKLATGAVSILIAPVEAAALKLFDRDYYAGLTVALKRGEEIDVETLVLSPWRHSRRLFPRVRPPRPHRFLRRRGRDHSQVRPRNAALSILAG
jgi:transcription-repair coupling factor (superfamily II helicase)